MILWQARRASVGISAACWPRSRAARRAPSLDLLAHAARQAHGVNRHAQLLAVRACGKQSSARMRAGENKGARVARAATQARACGAPEAAVRRRAHAPANGSSSAASAAAAGCRPSADAALGAPAARLRLRRLSVSRSAPASASPAASSARLRATATHERRRGGRLQSAPLGCAAAAASDRARGAMHGTAAVRHARARVQGTRCAAAAAPQVHSIVRRRARPSKLARARSAAHTAAAPTRARQQPAGVRAQQLARKPVGRNWLTGGRAPRRILVGARGSAWQSAVADDVARDGSAV
jgi:hypothetical protein